MLRTEVYREGAEVLFGHGKADRESAVGSRQSAVGRGRHMQFISSLRSVLQTADQPAQHSTDRFALRQQLAGHFEASELQALSQYQMRLQLFQGALSDLQKTHV